MRASVTVSIAEDDSGMARRMRRENWAEVSASEGITSLLLGRSRTSSNVKPVNANGSLAAGVVTVFMVPGEHWALANDSPSIGNRDGVGTVAGMEFAQDAADVGFNRVVGQAQIFANCPVGVSRGDAHQHLKFAPT